MVNSFKLISYDPHPPQTLLQQCWYDRCIDVYINSIKKAFDPGMVNMWWTRVAWNQLEQVDYSQTLSSSSKCGASPPGWATFQHTSNIRRCIQEIVFIRKDLGMGNKPYVCWKFRDFPGGPTRWWGTNLEDNVWEWSTPSNIDLHTTLIHHKLQQVI